MLTSLASSPIRPHFAHRSSLVFVRSPQPNTLPTLKRYHTYRRSGSLREINLATPSKKFNKSSPFPVGFSQLSYGTKSGSTMDSTSSEGKTSVYDFVVKDIKGNDVDFSQYKGKVLLIVNVASKCGLTKSNYTELTELYTKYKDQGLEILAFPCNQFSEEEPGTNEQIAEFACTRFKAEFPIFDKVDVNGDNATPIYKFLKSSNGGLFGDEIEWNFAKFLVDKDGNVVDRCASTTSPVNIENNIKKLLGVA